MNTTMLTVLSLAHRYGIAVKGDFARAEAPLVAMAASDGFITTREAGGLYGNRWGITAKGLRHMHVLDDTPEDHR